MSARRCCRRRAGRGSRVLDSGRDPGEVRTRGHHLLLQGVRRPRHHHRRHPDDAVHCGGSAARLGPRLRGRHLLLRGHDGPRIPAVVHHAGRPSAARRAGDDRTVQLAGRAPAVAQPTGTRHHLSRGAPGDHSSGRLGRQRQQGLRRCHAGGAGRFVRGPRGLVCRRHFRPRDHTRGAHPRPSLRFASRRRSRGRGSRADRRGRPAGGAGDGERHPPESFRSRGDPHMPSRPRKALPVRACPTRRRSRASARAGSERRRSRSPSTPRWWPTTSRTR